MEELGGDASSEWRLGCKVCRWFQHCSIWGRGDAKGANCRWDKLMRHHKSKGHAVAVNAWLTSGAELEAAQIADILAADDRHDVPCFGLCFAAWKGALRGASFSSFTDDVKLSRSMGSAVPRSRDSRFVAQKLVTVFGELLREEDAALMRLASHIHLSMDSRKGHLIVRARMTLLTLPDGYQRMEQQDAKELGKDVFEWPTPVRNVSGEHFLRVDRLLAFSKMSAYANTEDLAEALVEGVRQACAGDEALWESVRRKVFAFTPDGAFDEQLAGRMAAAGGDSPPFPNLRLVLRCSAHGVQGAIQAGWKADELSMKLTKTLVQEVAKYIRTSDRFAARVTQKQQEKAIAALTNFSFAPQRFSSRERPLARFVVFAEAILEALALEVSSPTSQERKMWATRILDQLDTSAWLCIAMLADLADDCSLFVRKLDTQRLDPVEFWESYTAFRTKLQVEYIRGKMWMRPETYTARMMDFLSNTRAVTYSDRATVLRRPTQQESRLCQAHVANVSEGILTYLKGEFPDCSPQALCAAFKLDRPKSEPRLDEFLRLMNWSEDRRTAALTQYNLAWPKVQDRKRARPGMTDVEAWAAECAATSPPELSDIVAMLTAFLVSETECERSFAMERIQFEGRPRLSPAMRFSGLKVMVDGAPLDKMQVDGRPVGRFWQRVQARYAARFGSRFLMNVKQRRRKELQTSGKRKRGGKETLTSIQMKRRRAVSASLRSGPETVNVFGYTPCAADEMQRLKEQERGALFQKLFASAKKKHDAKKAQHRSLRAGGALMTEEERESLTKKYGARRAKCSTSSVFGLVTETWDELLAGFQGDPWIFTPSDPPGAEDLFGGKPLRQYCTKSLRNFVVDFARPRQRMFLVPSVADMEPHLQLAAALTIARVQEHMLRPLLRYELRGPLTVSFTRAFALKHREMLVVAYAAADRPPADFWPAIVVLRQKRFWTEVGNASQKSMKQMCLLYDDDADKDLEGLTLSQKGVARTWTEFVPKFIQIKGVR